MFSKLKGLFSDAGSEHEPLTPSERARLEHRQRKLQRELRKIEKTLGKRGCSTCVKQEDPVGVRIAKRGTAIKQELNEIEARLDAA